MRHSHAAQSWAECMAEFAGRVLDLRQIAINGQCVTPEVRLVLLL
jgi:hypothetical protein